MPLFVQIWVFLVNLIVKLVIEKRYSPFRSEINSWSISSYRLKFRCSKIRENIGKKNRKKVKKTGYKYELEKDDNSTDKIPASEYSYYEGMNVVKMGDSYYFKVNIKSQDSEDEALLYSPSIISSISILVILVLAGRR